MMWIKVNIRTDPESPTISTIERIVRDSWPIPQIGTKMFISHNDNPTVAEGELSVDIAVITEISMFYNDHFNPTYVEIEALQST